MSKRPKHIGSRREWSQLVYLERDQDDEEKEEEENRKGEGLYRPETEETRSKKLKGRNRPGTASKPAGQTKTSEDIG